MDSLIHWFSHFPAATLSGLLFYGVLLAALLNRGAREWLVSRFVTPLPSTHAYSGALDAYRGIAATLVVLGHMAHWCYPVFKQILDSAPHLIWKGGNKAVPVFVILSGFLIYRSVRKLASMQDFRDYLHRRFLRIYPLYLVTAVAGIVVGQAVYKVPNLVSEIFMLRSMGFPSFVNPPAWSLYVEVCFYIVLPIFVFATGRWVFWASLGSYVVLLFADSGGPRELHLWKFFAVGIMVSHVCDWTLAAVKRTVVREALGATLFLLGAGMLYHDFKSADWFSALKLVPKDHAGYTMGLTIGFSLVMVGALCSSLVSRTTGIWPLRFLGTISYSIYLVHPFYFLLSFPGFSFTRIGQQIPLLQQHGIAPLWYGLLVFVPGLLFWAGVSYLVIERPFQMLRPRRASTPEAPPATVHTEIPRLAA
jgi:peptidoglycan/LPS O-acetylase OafA/YrhL